MGEFRMVAGDVGAGAFGLSLIHNDMVAGTLGAPPARSARRAKNWKHSSALYVSPDEWTGYSATGSGEG